MDLEHRVSEQRARREGDSGTERRAVGEDGRRGGGKVGKKRKREETEEGTEGVKRRRTWAPEGGDGRSRDRKRKLDQKYGTDGISAKRRRTG